MKKLKEEQDKADLEKLRAEIAEKRAKRSETPEHNTDHKNERTPDKRTLVIKMSKHPIIDQRLKQNRTFA